jgi:hypothetical protein
MNDALQMQLRDYLSVPYLLEARFVEVSPGVFVSHVSYPELPDCSAESPGLETALTQLERRRILTIIGLLDAGKVPPIPRPPLGSSDPVWIAEQSDAPADIVARIRRNEIRTINPA